MLSSSVSLTPSTISEDGQDNWHHQQQCNHYKQFLACLLPAEALKQYSTEIIVDEDNNQQSACDIKTENNSSKQRKRTNINSTTVLTSTMSLTAGHNGNNSSSELRSPSDFADWTEFHNDNMTKQVNPRYYTQPIRSSFPKTLDGLQEIYFARWLHVNSNKGGGVTSLRNQRNYSRSVKKKQRGFALDELLQAVIPTRDTPKLACNATTPGVVTPYQDDETDFRSHPRETRGGGDENRPVQPKIVTEVDPTCISDGSMKVLCHASAYLNQCTYIFGGLTAHGCPDDLWSFRKNEGLWRKVCVRARSKRLIPRNEATDAPPNLDDRPPPRYNHTLIGWENQLIVFGGDRGPGYSDDLWIFDILTNEWERVSLEVEQRGLRPGARAGHTACVYKNSMVLYGGWRGSDGFSDIWAFNLVEREWSPLCPHVSWDRLAGEPTFETINEGFEFIADGKSRRMPFARHWHVAAVFGDYLYIHGGYGAVGVLKEVWRFNLNDPTLGWEHIPTFGRMPSARCRHAGTPMDDRRWAILGGKDALGSYFNDFHILDIEKRLWQRIDLFSPDPRSTWDTSAWWNSVEILQRLPALHCHTMNYIPSAALFVIVGGCDGDCNAKNNTILLRRSPTAVLLFEEWMKGNYVEETDSIAMSISKCGEPYAHNILKFL